MDIFEIGSVRDPVWVDAEQEGISCIVTFPNHPLLPPTGVLFVARVDDPTAHGKQLLLELLEGTHGPIGAFVDDGTPPLPTPAAVDIKYE